MVAGAVSATSAFFFVVESHVLDFLCTGCVFFLLAGVESCAVVWWCV